MNPMSCKALRWITALGTVLAFEPAFPAPMHVDAQGNVFTTGPGGVLVLSSSGKHLGTLLPGQQTGNVPCRHQHPAARSANDLRDQRGAGRQRPPEALE